MSKFNKETQKSVRVVMPLEMYESLKGRCIDYGDMSRVVRHLVRKWLANPENTIRSIYDNEVALEKVGNGGNGQ
jgi:hypothetical protein